MHKQTTDQCCRVCARGEQSRKSVPPLKVSRPLNTERSGRVVASHRGIPRHARPKLPEQQTLSARLFLRLAFASCACSKDPHSQLPATIHSPILMVDVQPGVLKRLLDHLLIVILGSAKQPLVCTHSSSAARRLPLERPGSERDTTHWPKLLPPLRPRLPGAVRFWVVQTWPKGRSDNKRRGQRAVTLKYTRRHPLPTRSQ